MRNIANVFELHNVNFAYAGAESVFENLNLEVHQNDIIIIKGESGSGKSTFLKLFNRFCDVRDGVMLFHGKQLREYGIENIRSSIMYLSQLPYLVDGSVEDNLTFPFQFQVHNNKKISQTRTKELLDYFNLEISLKLDSFKLSIGQRQRLSLIRAILLEPEVLLLDEPGSSLDDSNRRNLELKIESLTDISGITVIMATHGEVSFQNRKHRLFTVHNKNLLENFSD